MRHQERLPFINSRKVASALAVGSMLLMGCSDDREPSARQYANSEAALAALTFNSNEVGVDAQSASEILTGAQKTVINDMLNFRTNLQATQPLNETGSAQYQSSHFGEYITLNSMIQNSHQSLSVTLYESSSGNFPAQQLRISTEQNMTSVVLERFTRHGDSAIATESIFFNSNGDMHIKRLVHTALDLPLSDYEQLGQHFVEYSFYDNNFTNHTSPTAMLRAARESFRSLYKLTDSANQIIGK